MTPRPLLLACLAPALFACASPTGEENFELSVGPSFGPDFGFVIGASQQAGETPSTRIDFEFDWTHQTVDEDTLTGDDEYDQVRAGFRWRWPIERKNRWSARTGVVWARARGDPDFLDGRGDYGGFYGGIGYEFHLGRHFVMGPDLTVMALSGQGAPGTGVVPQLAWRIAWQF